MVNCNMQSSVDEVWIEVLKLHTATAVYRYVAIRLNIRMPNCAQATSASKLVNVYICIYIPLQYCFLDPWWASCRETVWTRWRASFVTGHLANWTWLPKRPLLALLDPKWHRPASGI